MLLIIYAQLTDQWCTIGCFILFWKKMRSINKFEKSFGDNSECVELKYVLRKYTILLATNILSSWMLTLIITFTPLGIMAGQIDSAINMWTIVLFDAKYDNIYMLIFKCVATPITKPSNDGNAADDMTGGVNMVIHPTTTTTELNTGSVMRMSLVKSDSLKQPHDQSRTFMAKTIAMNRRKPPLNLD
eukprot:UN03500